MHAASNLRTRIAARVVAATVVALIALATLWPLPLAPQPGETFCIICGPLGGIDFIANLVLFFPLGFALRLGGMSSWSAVAFCAVLSGVVEGLQWQLIAGRDASAGDLLSNTLGGACGAWVGQHWSRVLRPGARDALLAASTWTLALALSGALAAWALLPAPPTLNHWIQWTPQRGGYAPFAGTLDQLSLYGVDRPNGTEVDPTNEGIGYQDGLLSIGMRLQPAPSGPGTALIARLGNPLGEQFQIAQRGSDLVFRSRRNASRLALRSPTFGAAGVLGGATAETREFAIEAKRSEVQLSALRPRAVVAGTPVTIGFIWQSLFPWEVSNLRWNSGMRAFVLLAALFPLGFWTARANHGRRGIVWCGCVALFLVGLAPAVAGISAGGWPEAGGALVGALLGQLVERRQGLNVARTSAAASHRSW